MASDDNNDSATKQRPQERRSDVGQSRDGLGFGISLALLWLFGLWFALTF